MKAFTHRLSQTVGDLAKDLRTTSTITYTSLGIKIAIEQSPRPMGFFITPRDQGMPHYAQSTLFSIALEGPSEGLNAEQQMMLKRMQRAIQEAEKALTPATLRDLFPKDQTHTSASAMVTSTPQQNPASLKIILSCNTACVFCAENLSLNKHTAKTITFPMIRSMLDKVKEKGMTAVSFDGGEPTLSPHIEKAVAYAHTLHFEKISIVTNGIRLANKAFLERLVKNGLMSINMSLHAADEKTARAVYRSSHLALQKKALANIHALKNRPHFTVQTVLNHLNQGSLDKILQTATTYHPDVLIIIYCMPPSLDKTLLPEIHSGHVLKSITAQSKKHPEIIVLLRGFPYCQIPQAFRKKMQLSGKIPFRVLEEADHKITEKEAPNKNTCKPCHYADTCPFPLQDYCSIYKNSRKKFIPITAEEG